MIVLHRMRAALAVLLTTFLALALLTACGSATDEEGGGDTGSSTSASVEVEEADGKWDGEELTQASFGERVAAAQKEAETFSMTAEQTTAGQTSTTTAEGRYGDEGAAVHSVTKSGDRTVETIVVDGFYYLKAPDLGTEKPWLKIDPKAKSGMGALIGQFGGSSDPTKLTEAFSDAVSIKPSEKIEEVDGVDTKQYAVSLPSSVLTETLGLPEQFTSMLPKTIDYDVWIDEEDLMRKMVMDLEIMGQKSSTEMTFTDYGKDVEIKAPAADETTTKEPTMPGGVPAPQG